MGLLPHLMTLKQVSIFSPFLETILTLLASESEKSETPPINVLQKEASARRTLLNEKKRESSLSEKSKASRTGSDSAMVEKRSSTRRGKDSSEESGKK